jgi:glycosyltransferase involved in cell wall biosynthesis
MKLNLFTPLPPARTDIAQCVARLLPALAARADVTLWSDQNEIDPSLEKLAAVRRYKPGKIDWRELSYADFNLYNVGNDARFHASIMDVAFEVPGIVVLHDAGINELAYHSLARFPFHREKYLKLMAEEGEEAFRMAEACFANKVDLREVAAKYPLAWWGVKGAYGVVTHNRPALDAALPNIDKPILDTPLPWTSKAAMRPVFSRTLDGRLEMVICGYLNSPNRRLMEVLDAMASFTRRERIFLHVAGNIAEPQPVVEKIAALGLADNVKLYGYMTEKALAQLLDRAHMAVNLRWPSMGEASGAQLRYWNHSLPSLVTRTGWYAARRPGTVLFVEPEHEAADLHKHWDAALDDYAAVARVGLAGRAELEKCHSAEVFADALLDFLPVADEYRRTAFVPKLAVRAGAAIRGLCLTDAANDLLSASAGGAVAGIAGLGKERA